MLIKIYFVVKPLKMVEYKVVKLQVPFFKYRMLTQCSRSGPKFTLVIVSSAFISCLVINFISDYYFSK